MLRWIFCRRCNPQFNAPAGLNTGIPNDCMACVVLCASADFQNQDIADQVMGEGNWSPGDTWALFNDGDDFKRDDSRPVAVTFSTVENPNNAAENIVSEISIDSGSFVWTRRNNDPDSPDFPIFDMTTGTIDAKTCNCGPCVTFSFNVHFVAFATDGIPEDFAVTVEIDQDVDAECHGTVTLCLKTTLVETSCDGWAFIGAGEFLGEWTATSDIYDGETLPDRCRDYGLLRIDGDGCGGLTAQLTISNNEDCAIFQWTVECGHDPRTAPDEGDFVSFEDTGCAGSLTSLTYGGDCGEGGGESNCPPDDCPTSYCKWQWNVDTAEWEILTSNCIDPAVCPDPPPDPAITTFPWIQCNCCVIVTPPNPCADAGTCPGSCQFTWAGPLLRWSIATSCDPGCTCCGMPDRDGLFIGETVDGTCCSIAGGGCLTI